MPVRDRFEALTKRSYRQAIVHLLETEYKIVGSHRVLEQLAVDVEQLNREYFGEQSKMAPGILCWRTQSLEDQKITYAKRTEDYKAKTIYLPLIEMSDIEMRMHHRPGPRSETLKQTDLRERAQMVRLLKSAYEQGASLTISELAVMMNRSLTVIGKHIKQYYATHPEETLPLRGYIYDQGSNPTHKALICTLHERGENEADIAKKTQHQLKSVGRYISHYTRVKQLMERGLGNREIAHILGIGERVVFEYNRIATHFHPELAKKVTLKKNKKTKKTTRGQLAL
jgi:DNA-binding NarL/FixJ family response regulator